MGQVVRAAPVKVGFVKNYLVELPRLFVKTMRQLELWPRGT